jgi:hypothetical protein
MMAWETRVNRELGDLNNAHSAARMGTSEYRQRRRALLQAVLLEGSASHTLRRPAGGHAPSHGTTSGRALPMRRAVTRTPPRGRNGLPWWLGGTAVFVGLLAWIVLR